MDSRIDGVLEKLYSDELGCCDTEYQVAYINCLNDQETAELLIYSCEVDAGLRSIVIRKIQHDLSFGVTSFHSDLVITLINLANESNYRVANGLSICLASILGLLSREDSCKVVVFLLSSKWVSFRRRGYKYLDKNYDFLYNDFIQTAWEKYQDRECTKIIVSNFFCDYLIKNKEKIFSCIDQGWLAARFIIRIGSYCPDCIENAMKFGVSTYCYCLVKLNRSIPLDKRDEIKALPHADGLLVWCLGRLKEWDLLEYFERKST